MLVIDETGFLKQGSSSCGVGRQYTGSAGKVGNCQIDVFAACGPAERHAFVDRALYLPRSWTADAGRHGRRRCPGLSQPANTPPRSRAPLTTRSTVTVSAATR